MSPQKSLLFEDDHFPPCGESIDGARNDSARKCHCGSTASRMTVKRGEHTGKEVYICSHKPMRCKFMKWATVASDLFEWKRLSNVTTNTFKGEGFQAEDIQQGKLMNCWLMTAISSIAHRQDLMGQIFPEAQRNLNGKFKVNLFLDGAWREITVDDRLPFHEGVLCYAQARGRKMWVPILEKAYAKAHGSYRAIIEGEIGHAFTDLTGAPSETYNLSDPEVNPCDLWTTLWSYHNDHRLPMACATAPSVNEQDVRSTSRGGGVHAEVGSCATPSRQRRNMGSSSSTTYTSAKNTRTGGKILPNCTTANEQTAKTSCLRAHHAYAILDLREFECRKKVGGKSTTTTFRSHVFGDTIVRMLRLRDPRSSKGGARESRDLRDPRIGPHAWWTKLDLGLSDAHEDGSFWIAYEDFLDAAQEVSVSLAYGNTHTWSFECAFPSKTSLDRFCDVSLDVVASEECDVLVMACQPSERGSWCRGDRKKSYKLGDLSLICEFDDGRGVVGKMEGSTRLSTFVRCKMHAGSTCTIAALALGTPQAANVGSSGSMNSSFSPSLSASQTPTRRLCRTASGLSSLKGAPFALHVLSTAKQLQVTEARSRFAGLPGARLLERFIPTTAIPRSMSSQRWTTRVLKEDPLLGTLVSCKVAHARAMFIVAVNVKQHTRVWVQLVLRARGMECRTAEGIIQPVEKKEMECGEKMRKNNTASKGATPQSVCKEAQVEGKSFIISSYLGSNEKEEIKKNARGRRGRREGALGGGFQILATLYPTPSSSAAKRLLSDVLSAKVEQWSRAEGTTEEGPGISPRNNHVGIFTSHPSSSSNTGYNSHIKAIIGGKAHKTKNDELDHKSQCREGQEDKRREMRRAASPARVENIISSSKRPFGKPRACSSRRSPYDEARDNQHVTTSHCGDNVSDSILPEHVTTSPEKEDHRRVMHCITPPRVSLLKRDRSKSAENSPEASLTTPSLLSTSEKRGNGRGGSHCVTPRTVQRGLWCTPARDSDGDLCTTPPLTPMALRLQSPENEDAAKPRFEDLFSQETPLRRKRRRVNLFDPRINLSQDSVGEMKCNSGGTKEIPCIDLTTCDEEA